MEDPIPTVSVEQLLTHRDWVRRVARSLVRDENAADDLEQDAWVEALESPPTTRRSIGGWFKTALRHNLIDRLRAEASRRRRELGRAPSDVVVSTAHLVARADAHKRVVVAVMELPEPYRSTVLHRFFGDMRPSVVAAHMAVPTETVRTRTRRALAMLRSRLEADSGEGREALVLGLAPLFDFPGLVPSGGATAAGASSVPATTALGGLLMTKKMGMAVVALLLVLAVTAHLRPLPGGDRDRDHGATRSTSVLSRGADGSAEGAPGGAPMLVGRGSEPGPSILTRWLQVKVLDEAGEAVPDITVRCILGTHTDPFGKEATGDGMGSVTIEVPAEAPCLLVAKAEGFEDTESSVGPGRDSMLIVMRGKRYVAGAVFDKETGEPVSGARVRVVAGADWSPAGKFWDTATSRDGSFRREGLPPGKFVVGVGLKAGSGDWDYDEVRVGPIPADTKDLRVELVAGPVLAGIVLDEAGKPFRGPFKVSARTVEAARTDVSYLMQYGPSSGSEAGRFRIRHIEPGVYELIVYPVPVDGAPQLASGILRRVVHGSEGLEVHLVRGLPIEGRAVHRGGAPATGVRVLRVFGPEGHVPLSWTRGDVREGHFTTGQLDPRLEYDVLLTCPSADGREQLSALLKRVRPGTRGVEAVMSPPTPIAGFVLSASGEPVGSGVPVTAQCLDYRFWQVGLIVTAYTNAAGAFSLPVVGPPDDLRFRLCAGGGTSGLTPVVAEGPFHAGQRGLKIKLPAVGETMEGIARLPTGAPAKGLRLIVRAALPGHGELGEPWYVESRTDIEGRFRVGSLPPGVAGVWIRVKGKELYCGAFEVPSTGLVQVAVPKK